MCKVLVDWLFVPFSALSAFNALTLLVGCQEGHPAHKNLTNEVLAWLSSGVKCKYLAYGSADATATPSCLLKILSSDMQLFSVPAVVKVQMVGVTTCL